MTISTAVAPAFSANLLVTWKNGTTYTDGSVMPATDIVSSTVACGLTQTTLTLTATVPGALQTASIPGALAGKVYVCGVMTNSRNNGSSATAFSNNATVPAPAPSPPTGVGLTVTADTTTYKLRQAVDGISLVSIGTLAPQTACDASQSVNGYFRVPRAAVKLASRFDTLPLTVYAQCS